MAIERTYFHGPGGLVDSETDIWPEGRGAVQAFRNVLLNPGGGIFYVGQTARLVSRRSSHGRKTEDPRTIDLPTPTVKVPGGVYQEMHVIFRTDSDPKMRLVEKQLENWSKEYYCSGGTWDLGIGNRTGGGGGRRTTGPYYIYVLRGMRPGNGQYLGPGYRGP